MGQSLKPHLVPIRNSISPHLYSYLIPRESEQLLPQPVAFLRLPLLGQELDNGFSALEKLVTVTPDRVSCVGFCDFRWVPV